MIDLDELEARRRQIQTRLDGEKSLKERNRLGQYSTPYSLAFDIMSCLARTVNREPDSFLEPAIGTGAFYSAFLSVFKGGERRATGFEIDPVYGVPSKELWKETPLEIRLENFLTASPPEATYSLLVTNPPYSRHHAIPTPLKRRLRQAVDERYQIKISGLAGLYCYFLILSTLWLEKGGTSCWLIPSEFMDVNFGQALKRFLLEKVELLQIHRFPPENLRFSDALITSSVVIFKNEKSSNDSVVFSSGASVDRPSRKKRISKDVLSNRPKWSPLFSNAPAATKTERTIGDYFFVKRGLATGNNKFFILDDATVRRYEIPAKFLVPLIPSPRYLNENIVFATSDGTPDLPTKLFLFNCRLQESELRAAFPKIWDYIAEGAKNGVDRGYICRRRTPWYSCEQREPAPFLVPYMGRRDSSRKIFRCVLNESNAVATNVYLMLYPKEAIVREIKNKAVKQQIWRILNDISIENFLENGRVYGGGLYKLEPKELTSVPLDEIDEFLGIKAFFQPTLF